jgi:hypothetical protein
MQRPLQSALLVLSLALTAGCTTTMNVSSHVQRGLNVSQYRTYDWGPADALPTGDPRLDKDPFFKDHLEGAMEKALARRGFEQATSGTPDLLIHYHANISQRIDVNEFDRSYEYCGAQDCPISMREYEAGTVVLDFVDTRTNRVIWRAWAQDRVEGILKDRDKMEEKVNEAVTRMMERFGPAR